MATILQGNPYNLQGNSQNLQGGSTATALQPAGNPQQVYGPSYPVPVTSTPKQTTAQPAATPIPASPVDLSSRYGLVGSTVYRKSDNYAFTNATDFLNEAGLKGFDGVRFDTAYNPASYQSTAPISQSIQASPTVSSKQLAVSQPSRIDELQKSLFALPKDSQSIYDEEFKKSGLSNITDRLSALDAQITNIRSKYIEAADKINENPWLSEASRVGRASRLSDKAQAEISNYLEARSQLVDLYNLGLNEVNLRVGLRTNDLNNQRTIQQQELEYLLSQNQTAQSRQDAAREFATTNNITQPFFEIGGTIYRTSDFKAYSTPEEFYADGGAHDFSNAQKVAQTVKPVELSPGNTLVDPNTGKVIYQAPFKPLAGSSGGGGGSGSLSPEAQAVINGTLKLEDLTPTVRGRIAGELLNAGYTRTENLNAGQRESIDQYDTLLREAQSAQTILDSGIDLGQIASRIKAGQAIFGGAQEYTQYNSIISNLSSILLRLRSGAAVTPQEYDRIKGFIPLVTDDEKTAKTKIARFFEEITKAQENYIKRSTQTSQQITGGTTQITSGPNNDPLGLGI